MIKRTGAALCLTTLSLTAANLSFSTPTQWSTLRTKEIAAMFVADSTMVGKQVSITLTKNDGSEKIIQTKSIAIKDVNQNITFPISETSLTETGYLSLKWKAGEQEGVVAPFAIAPVVNAIDPTATKIVTFNGEPSRKTVQAAGANPVKVGTAEVLLGWNPSLLAIVVQGTGTVEVNLDIDNSKSAFLSFSDRKVTIDFDTKKISYSFCSRRLKDNLIVYTPETWSGDMNGDFQDGGAIITLPWYDLGAKPFVGRQLGMSASQGDAKFPNASLKTTPATWGNVLLK